VSSVASSSLIHSISFFQKQLLAFGKKVKKLNWFFFKSRELNCRLAGSEDLQNFPGPQSTSAGRSNESTNSTTFNATLEQKLISTFWGCSTPLCISTCLIVMFLRLKIK
jgi:hypothetical protein